MSKYSPYILYLAIALLVVVLSVNDFGPLNSLQRSLDDLLCRVTADSGIRPNVVLVDIDGAAIDQYGSWPWDHDLIADLTAAVAAGEPKSILLDIELYEDAEQDSAGYTDILADQLNWMRQTVLTYDIALSNFRSSKTRNPEYLFNSSIQVDNPVGLLDEGSTLLVRKVFLPAEKLLLDKPLLGFKFQRPDPDRFLRHQPLVMNYDGFYYPSASLLTAATFLGVSPDNIKITEGQSVQVGPGRTVPINRQGDLFVKFSQGVPFARYSAAQVLSEDFNRESLKNKAVVIGPLNGYESENFDTPVEPAMPEMLIVASTIENIVNGNFLVVRNDLANLSLILLMVLGGLCAFVLPRVSMMYRMIILGGGLILLANANYLVFSTYGMMVPTVFVGLELILFMLASPMLESGLLSNKASEKPKPVIKADANKKRDKARPEPIPFREISSSSTDPENVKTTALSAANDSASGIDHQTINLDEPIPESTAAAIDGPTDSGSFAFDEPDDDPAHLTDSDAALLTGALDDQRVPEDIPAPQPMESTPMPFNHADLRNLGRYQIQGILGKGAMGTVYRGVDPAINRPVALKTIRLDFVSDPEEMAELKERLTREGQAAGKLSHPNIVTIYDVGSEGSLQYIAMEFLEGQTLENMIKKKTRFNYKIIAQMITQICSALEYAHERGIVHRDIKPANIMVLGDYRVKVMDFGIARVDSNSMTKTGIAMGTPNYISPEQLRGQEIDRRADIFSLGVMMYEMLLGRRPFKGENLTSLMYAVLNQEPEKPSSVRPQVPLLFDHIIGRALKKDPAARYQKASEVMADLQDFVESFSH
jgi:serine/threonine-protein kinase